jgi:hypothetical protein
VIGFQSGYHNVPLLKEEAMEDAMRDSLWTNSKKNGFAAAITLGFALLCMLALPVSSWAHGFAGKRFFPTTLAIEDPFVSDEFSLLFGHIKESGEGDEPPTEETEFEYEWAKRITPNLGISIGQSYIHLKPEGEESQNGFGNLELGLKYQFFTSAEHETLFSVGIGAEIGGTGASRVGAESFSVISPALFFGKGFGDLPESVKYLRPFAITGVIGPNFPTSSKNITTHVHEETGEVEEEVEYNPDTLSWGFSLQYSLQYLQSFVKDVGLGTPFNRMILLVEFPMETCLNRGCNGQTTGTINPGIIWFGKSVQLGIEARFPVNGRSGKTVGVFGLLHFFIDDLFPKSIGAPIFH